MPSTPYTKARAQYASLCSTKPANDPEVMTARQRMQEEATVAAIEKALTKAPSLTDELRARIIAMLS